MNSNRKIGSAILLVIFLVISSFSPSNAVGETIPTLPLNVQIEENKTTVTVMWTAPLSDGGLPITGYSVTTNIGGFSCSTTTELKCVISNLEPTVTYTFMVFANNQVGQSEPGLSVPTKINSTQYDLVHFGYRSSNLNDHAKVVLRKLAKTIHDGEIVRLLGFTQTSSFWNRFIFNNNMALARNRAEAVRHFLKKRGVVADFHLRIFGPTRHISWTHQELNRRVVIFVKHVPQTP
jgi:outer membrane protein OmpA-like peptidoglycan-associated protein